MTNTANTLDTISEYERLEWFKRRSATSKYNKVAQRKRKPLEGKKLSQWL